MLLLALPGDLFHYITDWLSDVDYMAWIQSCTTIYQSLQSRKYHSKTSWHNNEFTQTPWYVVHSKRCLNQMAKKTNFTQWQSIQHLSLCVTNEITVWPSQLRTLSLDTTATQRLDQFPHGLTCFTLYSGIDLYETLDHLPSSLTHLKLHPQSSSCWASLDHLPEKLQTLSLHMEYHQYLDYLPTSLTELNISCQEFDRRLDYLPTSLKSLSLKTNLWSQPLDHLPEGLLSLQLYGYHHPLEYLPSSLLNFNNSNLWIVNVSCTWVDPPPRLQKLTTNILSATCILPPTLEQLKIL
jgi:hypothetical protein